MISEFKNAVQFQPQGEPKGNLTLGRGMVDGKPVHIAIIENKLTSGAIGVAECDKLASLFRVVAAQRQPVVLFIDSAGARVSEGLPALGAFRRMFQAALKCHAIQTPMLAVIGTNCFGGASMLASLCSMRYFNTHSKLAMSGPTILAATAGASVLDEAFRAIADASIGQAGRLKLSPRHLRFEGLVTFLAPGDVAKEIDPLQSRLVSQKYSVSRSASAEVKIVNRKDITALYPNGYSLREIDGVLSGNAGADIVLTGSIDKRMMTAGRAHLLCLQIKEILDAPALPRVLNILIDCESHSSGLDDEKVMLSEFLVSLSVQLWQLAQRGVVVETTVLGKLGGGVYVALAAASSSVYLLHGAQIQVLPSKAIAAILGDSDVAANEFAAYLAAGVAERELKLGLVDS